MITTLSFLIKNIYYFFKNIIKKYKYFSDTLKGKTDSILLFHKRYEITEEKKQIMIKFMKFYEILTVGPSNPAGRRLRRWRQRHSANPRRGTWGS